MVQGLAPVQCGERVQRRESVIRSTNEGKAKNKMDTLNGSMVQPISKELPTANEASTIGLLETSNTSYDVTLEQRQPTLGSTFEKTSKRKTTRVWWPAPRCTTWWSGCNEGRANFDFIEERSFINSTQVLNGMNRNMKLQYSKPTDIPTSDKRPYENNDWVGG